MRTGRAALAAVSGDLSAVASMREAFDRRRRTIVAMLNDVDGFECPEPRGAFYAYPDIGAALGKKGIQNTLQFSERLLAESHVAVVPGEAFGTNRHVRISYATSMKELERGLDRLQRFIAARV